MTQPHSGQPVLVAGPPLEEAKAALILVHGRGATAESILSLGAEVAKDGLVILAPQAANNTWYPQRFTAPIAANEPYLSSALATVGAVLEHVKMAGIPAERTILAGFSQGACLTLEFGARNAERFGGLIGLSGGLIGPEGTTWDFGKSLEGTPVFLGCSDIDAHIPLARVNESAAALEALGATVDKRIYPRMGHTVNQDEIDAIRGMIDAILP